MDSTMDSRSSKKPKLPVQQLTILSLCRFAEPVAATSVNPYIPEMIQSFDVPADQAAKYTGWLSATFSLSQCLLAIVWGRGSDYFGRKPMILLALTSVMIGSLLFGFSSSLQMAFLARSLQGLASGNVGIIRTCVAEMVPQKELQPRAFSIMPLVWNIGSIFGPSIGGSLVNPVKRYGGFFKNFPLLERYPFALPNLTISALFVIGITSGVLFLHETHEDKKDNRDFGLAMGRLITRSCRQRKRAWSESDGLEGEDTMFLSDGTPNMHQKSKSKPRLGWKAIFSRQSNINLIAYTGLAMHNVAFDQMVPVFMNYPTNDQLDQPVEPPFRFAGGFGLRSDSIGLLFTIYGVFGMIVQFLIFPPTARRFGILRCFKACALTFPIVYILIPFTSLIPTNGGRQTVCLALMLVKCVAGIFGFPCSTILLTNSAASLQVLGTLNGVATSVSALGRAAGPALAGAAFAYGVDAGFILVPFWTLAAVAIVAAIPVWWLIEMEGFAARDEDVKHAEERESLLNASNDDAEPDSESIARGWSNDVGLETDETENARKHQATSSLSLTTSGQSQRADLSRSSATNAASTNR